MLYQYNSGVFSNNKVKQGPLSMVTLYWTKWYFVEQFVFGPSPVLFMGANINAINWRYGLEKNTTKIAKLLNNINKKKKVIQCKLQKNVSEHLLHVQNTKQK